MFMNSITYKRNDRALHVPSGCKVTVQQAAHDGSWVDVKAEGWKHGKRVKPSDLTRWVEPVVAEVRDVETHEFSPVKTMCDHCRFATTRDCAFFRYGDIEAAIQDIGYRVVRAELAGVRRYAYKVVGCPKYERGHLPPLDDAIVVKLVRTGMRLSD